MKNLKKDTAIVETTKINKTKSKKSPVTTDLKAKAKPKAIIPVSSLADIKEVMEIKVVPVIEKVKIPEVVKDSTSKEIWESIKGLDMGLFGLANQTVEKYCTPMDLDPSKCMLKYNVSSVIPALEAVVMGRFDFEVSGSYLVISKKV